MQNGWSRRRASRPSLHRPALGSATRPGRTARDTSDAPPSHARYASSEAPPRSSSRSPRCRYVPPAKPSRSPRVGRPRPGVSSVLRFHPLLILSPVLSGFSLDQLEPFSETRRLASPPPPSRPSSVRRPRIGAEAVAVADLSPLPDFRSCRTFRPSGLLADCRPSRTLAALSRSGLSSSSSSSTAITRGRRRRACRRSSTRSRRNPGEACRQNATASAQPPRRAGPERRFHMTIWASGLWCRLNITGPRWE